MQDRRTEKHRHKQLSLINFCNQTKIMKENQPVVFNTPRPPFSLIPKKGRFFAFCFCELYLQLNLQLYLRIPYTILDCNQKFLIDKFGFFKDSYI
jgi:hypothetical protein